ncbi:hypothetical protein L195_g042122, partial [Trifolium pratense]
RIIRKSTGKTGNEAGGTLNLEKRVVFIVAAWLDDMFTTALLEFLFVQVLSDAATST